MVHPAMRIEPHSRAKTIRRRLLKHGPSDQRVIDKYALLDAFEVALTKGSSRKRLNELAEKIALKTQEIQAAEAEQRQAIATVLDRARRVKDPEARTQKLVEAFEICTLIQIVALDDFDDDETADRAVEAKHKIVALLDAIGDGRRLGLAALLDSHFAGIRASAGAHLLNANLLSERIVPLLQEIEANVSGSAGWIAFWALSPDDHGAWLTGEIKESEPGEF